jgi:small GTP-binding protein
MESPKFKVIILGDTGVGKTSIARRRVQNTFDFKMNSTVGASHLRLKISVGGQDADLMLWDTAGQEKFSALVPIYARGAHVCLIVASIVHPDSIDNVALWRDRLEAAGEKPPIIVAVNKLDLAEGAPVGIEEVRQRLSQFPILYFVSARTGYCIQELFIEVAQAALGMQAIEDAEAMPKKNGSPQSCC